MCIFQCAPATSAIQIRGAENSADYLPKMNKKESCLENRDSSFFMAEIAQKISEIKSMTVNNNDHKASPYPNPEVEKNVWCTDSEFEEWTSNKNR